ncbi:hypothetical protein [Falsiroseomonas stagni]|uniref:Uncharacterized protein n=1 Tax=Falsiroseomonas stagni DSM 19981 TaxID=1123062 RepID=A0A1I3XWR1_9PROT|nr:hypothetical protein [Falsiroseomonas stagni]SFK23426.1 hypothetical protein SAMN02745775_101685 [Falsiroseomonas stagni DSM 19981]
MRSGAGLVAAGIWLGPLLALLLGGALQHLAGGGAWGALLAPVIAASILAGAPAAMLAAFRGSVAGPAGVAALGGGLAAMALLLADGTTLPLAATGALSAAALVALWVGLVAARAHGASLLLPGAVGAAAALAWVAAGTGSGTGLLALGLGAALAALPGVAAGALLPVKLRAGTGPVLAGMAMALAAVAGPGVALLRDGPAAALALAPLVAVPGLALVAAHRLPLPGLHPLRLATLLLALQALVVVLALAAEGAPVAAGLMPAEQLPAFRAALLGAAFLPVFAALLAVMLARDAFGRAALAALLFALLAALATAIDSATGMLLAPLAATAVAAWLVARLPKDTP